MAVARKPARRGKIFIDYLRNGRGATSVAAYSPRARPRAPVSTPLAWDELGDELRPDRYDLRAIPGRLAALSRDPWAGLIELEASPPSLAPAAAALGVTPDPSPDPTDASADDEDAPPR